ncbi:hypothetical protein BGW39_000404 [Mortierella sp. 14UC]|nr:hypothetical protein BGW39_000404 [Mortierella sp. 14UC]
MSTTPLTPGHTPFAIPELLEKIFAYLDQRTLSSSAILVSRTWFHCARPLIVHELIWHDGWDVDNSERLQKALSRLPWLTRIHWNAIRPDVSDRMKPRQQWNSLIQALGVIQAQYQRQQLHSQQESALHHIHNNFSNNIFSDNSIISFPVQPPAFAMDLDGSLLFPRRTPQSPIVLQEIELSGCYGFHMIPSLLPNLSFLIKLTLRFTDSFRLNLSGIFEACQKLQDLNISSEERAILEGPWVNQHVRHTPLPLRSLVLSYTHFNQLHLQDLLTLTPSLKRLKVINPLQEYGSLRLSENRPIYNAQELARHINTLPLKLDHFHFTGGLNDITTQVCPNTSERTFWREDFTADMEKSIQTADNVVTSLELFFNQPSDYKTLTSTLHRFLCSTPHLLHLKAPQLGYQLEHMDLHGQLAFTTTLPFDFLITTRATAAMVPTYYPGIWACRNLQTLHLRIRAPYDHTDTVRPLHSRIVFGYIARVCPNLRDLNLTNIRNSAHCGAAVDLRLVGGLCLLGCLQHLERLVIGYWGQNVVVRPLDVNWMVNEGRTLERRQERKRVMAWWTGLIQTEDSIRALPSAKRAKAPMLFDWRRAAQEPGMKASLQHLGSLLDVQLAIEAMDDTSRWVDGDERGPRWFPVLRYACFANESGLEVPLEIEVKRLLTAKPKEVQ